MPSLARTFFFFFSQKYSYFLVVYEFFHFCISSVVFIRWADYRSERKSLTSLNLENTLVQNTIKTKELVVDFRKNVTVPFIIGKIRMRRRDKINFQGTCIASGVLSWTSDAIMIAIPFTENSQKTKPFYKGGCWRLSTAALLRVCWPTVHHCLICQLLGKWTRDLFKGSL